MSAGRIDEAYALLTSANSLRGAARAAFLRDRCADPALRSAVESLLLAVEGPIAAGDAFAPRPDAGPQPSEAPTLEVQHRELEHRELEHRDLEHPVPESADSRPGHPAHRPGAARRAASPDEAETAAAPLRPEHDDGTIDLQAIGAPGAGSHASPSPGAARLGGAFQIGPYRIVRTLGEGGMGTVFEAVDERLGRRVALKAIRARWRLEPAAMARLLREARVLSSLQHPNICVLFDYVEQDDGAFLVLEYVEGQPLGKAAPTLRTAERLRVAEQIAAALVAAHAAGVVHRDLKPDNVMVGPDGSAKVLDFGIARPAAGPGDLASSRRGSEPVSSGRDRHAGAARSAAFDDGLATMPGALVGTPMYMSPEQASGGEATAASDLFAFGLLLHELFGAAPGREGAASRAFEYDGDLERLLERVRRAEVRPLRGVDRELSRLIRDLTAAAPAARPTAAEAARRLARRRARPLRRAVAVVAGAALLLAAGGAVKYTLDLERERSVAVEARGDAENLVSFMTETLRDKLAPVGRLDVLGSVAEEVIGYYAKRDPATLSEPELAKYAKGLQLIGEVQLSRKDADLASAERAFLDALPLLTALEQRRPNDGPLLKSLGAAHFWLGSIAYRRGDLPRTLEEFGAYRALAERLVALDASNPEWQLELAYADSSLVQVHRDRGDQDAARRALDASLATKRRLVELRPENSEFQRSLANGLTYLAESREAAGDGEGALAALAEALELLAPAELGAVAGAGAAAAPSPPADAATQYRVVVLHLHRGELFERLQRPAEALRHYRSGQDVGRSLLELDPSNSDWQREMAVSHRLAGSALRALGELESARQELDASRRLLAALLERDAAHAKWSDDLANTELLAAMVAESDGRWADARRSLAKACALLDGLALRASDANRRDAMALRAARMLRHDARVCTAAGDHAAAAARWNELAVRLATIGSPAQAPERDRLLAFAFLELDRLDEARPIVARLRSTGGASAELEAAASAKGM